MPNNGPNSKASVRSYLDRLVNDSEAPGIQYVALNATEVICRHECGLSVINGGVRMNSASTMMAYSMSKTITAVAVLKLAAAQQIRLEEPIDHYLTISP